jgi:hypothetical protein
LSSERLAEAAAAQFERALDLLAAEPSIEGSDAIGRCLSIVEAEVAPLAREK